MALKGTGRDFIGSFVTDLQYWAQMPQASHVSCMAFLIPCLKRTSRAIRMLESEPK